MMLGILKHFSVIPSTHPILVHFTIYLASISFVFYLIYYFTTKRYPKSKLTNRPAIVARWSLWLAIASSILTIAAGFHNKVGNNMSGMDMSKMNPSSDKSNSKTPLYWSDPMEPTVHYSKPGKSAMGMDLVPVYPNNTTQSNLKNTIEIPQGYVDNLGVITEPVISSNMDNSVEAYATIEANESRIAYVTFYANGWIRNLVIKNSGSEVKKGQLLAQIYSPTIINAQQEYIIALQSGNKTLSDAAVKKLSSLHVSDIQIAELKKSKSASQLINIYAPQDGIIGNLTVREGDYITPDTKIFNITDLSSVWLIAQIFEKQSSWIKLGNEAIAKFPTYPDRSWHGVVEYIYPELESQTRSLRIRLRFNNPNLLLKPKMYGSVIIAANPKFGILTIPSQAVIRDDNGIRVIVALGNGLFQVRKITTGEENNGRIQVLSGLNIGESVVKSGEFMIDSEANISGALDNLNSQSNESTSPAINNNHSTKDMH